MTVPKIGDRVQYAEVAGARWWMGDVVDVDEKSGVTTVCVVDHTGIRTVQRGCHHADKGSVEGVWRFMSEA